MWNNSKKILVPGLLCLLLPFLGSADDTLIKMNLRQRTASYTASAEDQTLEFYAVSKGNETIPVWFQVSAPVGAQVSVRGAQMRGRVTRTIKKKRKFWDVFTSDGSRQRRSWTVGGARSRGPEMSGLRSIATRDFCAGLTEEQMATVAESIESALGRPVTVQEACDFLLAGGAGSVEPGQSPAPTPVFAPGSPEDDGGSSATGDTIRNSTLTLYGRIDKDACKKKRGSKYVVIVSVDLSNVPLEPGQNAEVEVTAQQIRHKGRKSSSIKPVSDGKFAPKPLVLMQTSGYRPEEVSLIRWKRGKPKSIKNLPIESYLPYQGLYLARMVVDGYLNGGRGTFQIVGGENRTAYGVCFALDRRRQSVFGYPK